MQPLLTPASDAQFRQANGAFWGWALVLGLSLVSFFIHLHPDEGLAIEQAAQGVLAKSVAAVLVHGGVTAF